MIFQGNYLVCELRGFSSTLISFLEKEKKLKCYSNPNFYFCSKEVFQVEDAHLLRNFKNLKSEGEENKIIIIESDLITKEAQNALLKSLEEHHGKNYLFIIIPFKDQLILPLLSRLEIFKIPISKRIEDEFQKKSLEFLKSDYLKRLDFLQENLLKEKESSDFKIKVLKFLNALEFNFFNCYKINNYKVDKKFIFSYKEILKNKKYLLTIGSSSKMILENLALILPIIK